MDSSAEKPPRWYSGEHDAVGLGIFSLSRDVKIGPHTSPFAILFLNPLFLFINDLVNILNFIKCFTHSIFYHIFHSSSFLPDLSHLPTYPTSCYFLFLKKKRITTKKKTKIKLKKRKISKIKIPKQNERTHTQREGGERESLGREQWRD